VASHVWGGSMGRLTLQFWCSHISALFQGSYTARQIGLMFLRIFKNLNASMLFFILSNSNRNCYRRAVFQVNKQLENAAKTFFDTGECVYLRVFSRVFG